MEAHPFDYLVLLGVLLGFVAALVLGRRLPPESAGRWWLRIVGAVGVVFTVGLATGALVGLPL